jgi:hypothetical protein
MTRQEEKELMDAIEQLSQCNETAKEACKAWGLKSDRDIEIEEQLNSEIINALKAEHMSCDLTELKKEQ